MTTERLHEAVEAYRRAQDELVEARNRLARAIAGAAMSGMTRDEIVDLTGYPAALVLRICQDAGVSDTWIGSTTNAAAGPYRHRNRNSTAPDTTESAKSRPSACRRLGRRVIPAKAPAVSEGSQDGRGRLIRAVPGL
jgi:hypothetical protein